MDGTALYLITLLMLIITSSALEDSALSEKQRVKRNNRSNASDPGLLSLTNLRSTNWAYRTGWYEQGQFPNSNGCGGDITAIEDYEYGSLTSPNWPRPLPSQIECTWRLRGFNSLFFVVNGLPSQNRSNEDGRLTVRIRGQSNQTEISLGGDYLHQQVLLNVNQSEILLTLTMNLRAEIDPNSTGTKVTWWTVPAPNAAFVKIFNPQLSLGEAIESTYQLSRPIERNKGYIFLFKNDISLYDAVIRLTLLQNQRVIPCKGIISVDTISYNKKEKLLRRLPCNPDSKQHTLAVIGYNQPTSTPFGIEITIPKVASHVKLSINAVLAKAMPAYTDHQDCITAFNASMTNGLGYFGTANFTAANNTSVKYKAGLRCDLNINVPMSILDSFFQVQTQTDIQLSPSCVVDFLQIGGQRVCGNNKPDTYISSPVDNSLIERTGTYYANILHNTNEVFASPSVSDTYSATLALDPHLDRCYLSDPSVSSPLWMVDMADVFIVQAIRIVVRRVDESNFTVVVYINEKNPPWPEQYYQTCWSGSLTSSFELLSCHRPVSGRHLAIFKESVNLTLCKVEVFVNIAAPVVTWRNVAYGKTVIGNINPSSAYNDFMVDGDYYSCRNQTSSSYFYNISLGKREFTVQAVSLYGSSNESQIGFQVKTSEQHCTDYEGRIKLYIHVSCTIPMVTNHVFIRVTNLTRLCEIIIFAEVNDKTNANAALHTEASKSLRSRPQRTSVPMIVDGILTSCDSAEDAFSVDLTGLHIVEGVILNLGDNQQNTVQVEVWVSHSTSNAEYLCHGKAYTDTEVLHLLCSLPIVGNHVILNIIKIHDEVLHLCELQVIAVPYDKENGLQNVALFKHVRHGPDSSLKLAMIVPHVIYHGQGARLAVDGDRSHDDMELSCTIVWSYELTAAWWEVDLANMYHVKKVGLFWCRGVNKYNFSIGVSDGRAGSRQLCYNGPPRELVICTKSILGRYVRLTSLQELCLCEVEVMAAPLTTFERFGERPRHVKDSLFKLFSFVTDGYLEKSGFSTWYKIDNLKDFTSFADCGQLVRDHNTELNKNWHPYESYICHWMVYTPYDSFILVYIDFMILRLPVSQNLCLDEVLIISNSAGQQITKCGTVYQDIVNMKSYEKSYLHITMIVRKNNNPDPQTMYLRGGLHLRFLTYPNCIHKVIKVDPNNTVVLFSPLYPKQPPPYAWCRWILEAKVMGIMELIFMETEFEPELSARRKVCDTEVLIRSRHNGVEKFCPDKRPQVDFKFSVPLRLGDLVTIIFKTKKNVGRGFRLQYELRTHLHGLGHELGYNRTDYQSFRYPNTYETNNVTLKWTFISLHETGTIFLNFTDLQLGGGNFKVVSSITLHSRILHKINDTAYYMNTSEPQHFPVFPHTLFELVFVPNGTRDTNAAKFKFTYDFVPASFTVGGTKAFTAEISSRITTNVNSIIRFDRVRLQENILDLDHQVFFIMEAGLYVVSMRIIPEYNQTSDLLLKLNNQHTKLTAYGHHGQIASVSATLKLDKGDILSVFAYPDRTVLYEQTAFTVVYVSPIEGSSAFAGYQKENIVRARDIPMNFSNVLTAVSMNINSMYNTFVTHVAGIYWVTIRPGQKNKDMYEEYRERIQLSLYEEHYPYFLYSVGKDYVPGSLSAADYFKERKVLSIRMDLGVSGTRSLFSIVYLAKNIRRYIYFPSKQMTNHIAFSGRLGDCRWINPNSTTLTFKWSFLERGVFTLNHSAFMIPKGGLYIISIRIDLTDEEGCDGHFPPRDQHLYINVNGIMVATAFARKNPTEYVTVLRLKTYDILTVTATVNEVLGKDTLFSYAFVDV